MDEQQQDQTPQEEEIGYTPRPRWQVWLARVCLVLFIALIILYYINLMRS